MAALNETGASSYHDAFFSRRVSPATAELDSASSSDDNPSEDGTTGTACSALTKHRLSSAVMAFLRTTQSLSDPDALLCMDSAQPP